MNEEIELKELVKYFWSKKFLIILALIIGAVLGLGYTKVFVKPLYSASTTLILVEMEFEDEADVTAFSRLVDRYSVVASSRSVIEKTKENLKLDVNVDELIKNIEVTGIPHQYYINISVTNENALNAVNIANEIARVFKEEIKTIFNDDKLNILDYAVENNQPINDNLSHNIMIFSLLGVIISSSILLGIYFLKRNK